jgi:glucose uptake protein GlcU
MNKLIAHCPECKSTNINLRSKQVFLKRAVVCLIIFYCGYWIYDGMLQEKDVDGIVIIGLAMGIVIMSIAAATGVIWIIWVIITRKPTYKCAFCKNIFEIPVFTSWLAIDKERFHTIRKMNIKK